MNLAQLEAIRQEQAKEKEYSGMTVLQLIEAAKKENLDTTGDTSALVQRVTDKVVGKTKDYEQLGFEEEYDGEDYKKYCD